MFFLLIYYIFPSWLGKIYMGSAWEIFPSWLGLASSIRKWIYSFQKNINFSNRNFEKLSFLLTTLSLLTVELIWHIRGKGLTSTTITLNGISEKLNITNFTLNFENHIFTYSSFVINGGMIIGHVKVLNILYIAINVLFAIFWAFGLNVRYVSDNYTKIWLIVE